MKKALLLAPYSSVHEKFNKVNIGVLIDLKCEIHIAANFESGSEDTVKHNLDYKKSLRDNGIIAHQIPFKRSSLLKNLTPIRLCRKLFKEENFDIIHSHTETGGLITRISMIRNSKTKYVFTPHGISFYKGGPHKNWILYYPIEKWICGKMSAVLAMNTQEYETIKKWGKNNEKFIHGIGLDVDSIKNTEVDANKKRLELGIPDNAFLILSVGELNKNKNHEVIIKALARLQNPNIYYLICGVGPLKKELEKICASYNISERVIFAGYRRDIYDIVKIADLYAFPSYHEGLPVSLMEAMTAGLPVVCSKIRGNEDLIENGKGGFLCSPEDIDSFKENISMLLQNSELRKQISNFNLRRVNDFSYRTVYNETKLIYQDVLE